MLTRQVLENLVPLSDDMRTINKMRPGGTGLHIQWLWLLATVSPQQITVCVLVCTPPQEPQRQGYSPQGLMKTAANE